MKHQKSALRVARFGRGMSVVVAVAALMPMSVAEADILFGSTGNFASSGGGRIYRIDTIAQTATLVGSTGFDRTGGLAFDASGTLYVVAGGSAGPGTLLTFDIGSGVTTVIGSVNGVQGVDALAFDAAGTLWGAAWTGSNGAMVTINPGTGSVLSTLNMNGSGNSFVAGLAFHANGTLYGSRGNAGGRQDDVVTIDLVSGNHTVLGGMEAVISDLAFGLSGTLYGSGTNGDIYEINPSTGAKTFLFNTGITNLSGLTNEIPAPGALVVFGVGALAASRRRR